MMESSDEKFIMQYKQIINQIGNIGNENLDIESEVGDDESEQAEEPDDFEDDVNIEDEDFNQFGIPTGEDILNKFYNSKSRDADYSQSMTKRTENMSILKSSTRDKKR